MLTKVDANLGKEHYPYYLFMIIHNTNMIAIINACDTLHVKQKYLWRWETKNKVQIRRML